MKVLVYANVGLHLIDGSTIWVQSIVEILSTRLGCEVVLLSRDALEDRGVVPTLRRMKGVRIVCYGDYPDIVAQHPRAGDRHGVEKIIRRLDAEDHLDRMIIRDPDVSVTVARVTDLRSRLWAYFLDTPALDPDVDSSQHDELMRSAGGLIVQSDTQRGLLEAIFPAACNKTSILPPMVKPVSVGQRALPSQRETVRFVYSGKYSSAWNVEAFFDIPGACSNQDVRATITMIGDKVHDEKSDPDFRGRILHNFENTAGVTWMGAMEREAAIAESAAHDLGLCWRTKELNDSLEISTKFLEFASVGVPSVVNRTAAYQGLLGEDYPYFADTIDDVVAAASKVIADRDRHERIRRQCRALAAEFSYDAAAARLSTALRFRKSKKLRHTSRVRVLVASHDLKFLSTALEALDDTNTFDIRYDYWESTSTHSASQSEGLLQDADIIFCEWCAGQAVWYSQRKLPHQKLFIRLHRFEAFTRYPGEVVTGAIDGVIVVSDHFRDICVKEFGWPQDKIVVLPQYCLADQLRRPKHPGSEKTLGFVGINGFHHKRFDRAIEVLRLVRKVDPAFRMRIRSAMPWEFDWLWKDNAEERQKFEAVFRDLEVDRELRDAVIFDRPGSDMAEWYRRIGFFLSTSETEGCHTSVAEAICSGALPFVIDWPGARSIYGNENVFETVEQMADAILAASETVGGDRQALQAAGARDFDVRRTIDQLEGWFS